MLMTMGASKGSITRIFLIESLAMGTIGVIVGCLRGYFTSSLLAGYQIDIPQMIYFGLTSLPFKADAMNYVYATTFYFIINIVAGVYPARRAASLGPVEARESE